MLAIGAIGAPRAIRDAGIIMELSKLCVVSIHPDTQHPLDVDLKGILSAVGDRLAEWIWCVRDLDWLGNDASEQFAQQVGVAGRKGLWSSSQELLAQAENVYQTIEGQFVAFPREVDKSSLSEGDSQLDSFPTSLAVFAVAAIDGSYFDVYAKDQSLIKRFTRFTDVRSENPASYFPA